MSDSLDTSDDWAELARELERDKPPAPAPVEATDARPEDSETPPESEDAEGAEFEDSEEAPVGEAGTEGDGAGGTGRKRRRRRRRRRKGAPGDTPVAGATDDEGEAETEADEETAAEPVAETEDFDAPAGEEVEDFDGQPVALAAEEDTANDVLRELIATWNVPSWDSIVSGLYRPN